MTRPALIVIAKQPIPGRVKTRLVPPLSHVQAAQLAGAALRDTIEVVQRAPASRRVLAFDGDATGWLPTGWQRAWQPPGGLDERLVAAFEALCRGPAVLVGMDTPQLTPAHLSTFDPARFDACLGLADDGGYWAIGFADARCAASAIRGVPMSTSQTGAVQLDRLVRLGMRVQLLAPLTDVDTIDAAYQVSRDAPQTRFAAALDALAVPV